jgi:hypothetical protein
MLGVKVLVAMGKLSSSVGKRASTLCVVLGLGSNACDTSVDATFRSDLITVESMRLERVVPDESALLFVDLDLRNRTKYTVNNFFKARYWADGALSEFELGFNRGPNALVGCQDPDPWDIQPGETKAVRMRLDLRADPALLSVACEFDPTMPGLFSTRDYEAPRSGPNPSSDFMGPVELRLKAAMNAPCDPDDCPEKALVLGWANVTAPE